MAEATFQPFSGMYQKSANGLMAGTWLNPNVNPNWRKVARLNPNMAAASGGKVLIGMVPGMPVAIFSNTGTTSPTGFTGIPALDNSIVAWADTSNTFGGATFATTPQCDGILVDGSPTLSTALNTGMAFPLIPKGMSVNYVSFGSGARVALAAVGTGWATLFGSTPSAAKQYIKYDNTLCGWVPATDATDGVLVNVVNLQTGNSITPNWGTTVDISLPPSINMSGDCVVVELI